MLGIMNNLLYLYILILLIVTNMFYIFTILDAEKLLQLSHSSNVSKIIIEPTKSDFQAIKARIYIKAKREELCNLQAFLKRASCNELLSAKDRNYCGGLYSNTVANGGLHIDKFLKYIEICDTYKLGTGVSNKLRNLAVKINEQTLNILL